MGSLNYKRLSERFTKVLYYFVFKATNQTKSQSLERSWRELSGKTNKQRKTIQPTHITCIVSILYFPLQADSIAGSVAKPALNNSRYIRGKSNKLLATFLLANKK